MNHPVNSILKNSNSGYDIFLLIALFVACCFITRIKRNYHEGKCFFGTAVGLLFIWATWLICFVLMQPKNRDAVVSFGVIGTAYSIILGILIPRIYYMTTHSPGRKSPGRSLDLADLPTGSTTNTIIEQVRTRHVYHISKNNQKMANSDIQSRNRDYYASPT